MIGARNVSSYGSKEGAEGQEWYGEGEKRSSRPLQLAACRECGVIFHDANRTICDECLPDYDQARTGKLSNVGKATLAVMRASPDDPARSPEATAKKREKSRSTSLAMRSWEREHGRGDSEVYEREILPRIQKMAVPQLMKLTTLSQFHCWKVREGERRLHARHWDLIVPVISAGAPSALRRRTIGPEGH